MDLPGKYVATMDWGQATLILRPDHTMEQDVRKNSGAFNHISGSWEFANGFLSLKPCLWVTWKEEGVPAGGCASGVEVTLFGKVQISADSEHGLAYEKVKEN